MENRNSRIKGYFNTLVRNPVLKITIFVVGAICAFMIEFGAQKLLLNHFPDYYENDAQEVIQSQKKHFEDIRNSINTLKSELTSQESGKTLEDLKNLEALFAKANKNNHNLELALKAIKKETSLLREYVAKENGIDYRKDLRLEHARAIEIGNFIISANENKNFIRHNGVQVINRNYRQNSVQVTYSSPKINKSKILSVGESLNFQKNDSQLCTLGFTGESSRNVFDFSLRCKATK